MLSSSEIQKIVDVIQQETKDRPQRIREAITECHNDNGHCVDDELIDCVRKMLKIERLKDEGFYTTL